jgi:hypothetical protein
MTGRPESLKRLLEEPLRPASRREVRLASYVSRFTAIDGNRSEITGMIPEDMPTKQRIVLVATPAGVAKKLTRFIHKSSCMAKGHSV